ncbi:MAG: CDP-glucose 4,6-dehydratase [Saprospiraceae bacterium]|nr:CDP-glucose 4,6-dehydratase [Saprospiraceae bacterium]
MVRMEPLFGGRYKDLKVLITGHTGFKGSWLALWLTQMGAEVYGYALDPPSDPNHFKILDLNVKDRIGDIRDIDKLKAFVGECKPDIVFHLAAQSLVRLSYSDPVSTVSTNVIGTLNLLEACKSESSVRAIVNVTSDKCYENKEWIWGYRENDRMGGYDPYSVSKGMAELMTSSYRRSFFNLEEYGKTHNVLLASARAGNVIGGGDWAEDRLIPDLVRTASSGEKVGIRNPLATRPWQHVLEPLSGYLLLGWQLLDGHTSFASGWNFGPGTESNLRVGDVIDQAIDHWPDIAYEITSDDRAHHEANLLMLDCSKAARLMNWKPVWDFDETISRTIGWYRRYYEDDHVGSVGDIHDYVREAQQKNLVWTE